MKDPQVLDDFQFSFDFKDYLDKEEFIIWSDKPEIGTASYNYKVEYFVEALIFFLFLIILFIGLKQVMIALVVICLFFLLRPRINFQLHKRKTVYALTNKRLLFRLWKWNGSKVYSLNLEDIDRINVNSFEEGRGTLYFNIKKNSKFYVKKWFSKESLSPTFTTKSLDTREIQHVPTFESIAKANEIKNVILKQTNLVQKPVVKELVRNLKIPESELKLKEEFLELLPESKVIEWAGRPNVPFSFFENPARTGLSLFFNMIGVIVTLASVLLYAISGLNIFLLTLLVLFILFISPDPYKMLKTNKTRYAIIGSKLYFKIWHLWSTKVESIDIKDIEQIGLDEKESGNGTLYLQVKNNSDYYTKKKKKKFETVDLEYGTKQQFPTLEFVPDALQLRDAILEKKKELLKMERE